VSSEGGESIRLIMHLGSAAASIGFGMEPAVEDSPKRRRRMGERRRHRSPKREADYEITVAPASPVRSSALADISKCPIEPLAEKSPVDASIEPAPVTIAKVKAG